MTPEPDALKEALARCAAHADAMPEGSNGAWWPRIIIDAYHAMAAKLSQCRCWQDEHCPLHSIGLAEAECRVLVQRERAEAAESKLKAVEEQEVGYLDTIRKLEEKLAQVEGECNAESESHEITVTKLMRQRDEALARVKELISVKDGAYSERNRLVAALSKLFPASLERHPEDDKTWEDDWRWIVFMDLPTGQASWHLHDSELMNFGHLPRGQGRKWDGHSNDEKYARLAALKSAERGEGRK